MKNYPILLILLIFWIISGCESPTGGFERINDNDPLSPSFKADSIIGLQVSADTAGVITVRWAETHEITTKNVLEKSLGDTLNFTPIAELQPDIVQFSDTTREVRKNTYYRLSSYLEVADKDDILLGRSQAVLDFGEIQSLTYELLSEENSLRLSWSADVPFYTHVIISSENVISEQQNNTVKISTVGIKHSFVDPLLDIDFTTRKYSITWVIEYDGIEEAITEQEILFDVRSFFQPENVSIDVLNEQDWEVSWNNTPFFATVIEVTRFNIEKDIIFNLPAGSTSFIDSLIVDDTQVNWANHLRRYQVRFVTDTGASRGIIRQADIEIVTPQFITTNIYGNDPNSLNINWHVPREDRSLIKQFIIEKSHPSLPGFFREYARVSGNTYQYTDTNVNESEEFTYRVRTLTSFPSYPATYVYSNQYESDYSFSTGMTYVTSMEITSDKRYLTAVYFSSGLNNSIQITDIKSRQKIAEIQIPLQRISDFKISPDEQLIYFSVPSEGAIYKADFPSGNNKEKIIDDASLNSVAVFHIDVSSDGTFLIGTGGRGFVKRWNLNTYDAEFIFQEFNSPTFYLYKNIAISPDGAFIGGNNGTSYIMNAQNGSILKSLQWVSPNLTDIQFSADGKYYAFVEDFTTTHIYSTENWERIQVINNTSRAAFHPIKSKMVMIGTLGVFIYDLEKQMIVDNIYTENGLSPLPRRENSILYVDDNTVAAVSGSGTIQIWKKTGVRGWRFAYSH